MSNNIEWKKSEIDYNKLGSLTHADLVRIENGKNAVASGQFKEVVVKGGISMGKSHYENKTGLFGMDDEKKQQSHIKGGKSAGKIAAENGTVVKAGKAAAKLSTHPNNVKVKCEHCDLESTLPLYKRWHGDKCKHKK